MIVFQSNVFQFPVHPYIRTEPIIVPLIGETPLDVLGDGSNQNCLKFMLLCILYILVLVLLFERLT